MWTDLLLGCGVLAMAGMALIVLCIVFLAIYLFMAFALMTIGNKTKTKNSWLAFIPIANIYLMTQIVKISGWWTLLVIVAWIPFVGSLILAALTIYLWWKIAERMGRPGWWGILMIIPIVNFVIMYLLAWGKK